MNLAIPLIKKEYYKTADREKVNTALQSIKSKYSSILTKVSNLTNVPVELLVAMIFVESNGNEKAKSGASIGLMQISSQTASDIIFFENKQGRLSQEEKDLITKYIGKTKLDCITKMKYMSEKTKCNSYTGKSISDSNLYNAEFNIFCGAIFIGILLDDHTINGEVRLDQIIARYNRGFFTKIDKKASVTSFYNSQNTTTKNYITKVAGINSALDILV